MSSRYKRHVLAWLSADGWQDVAAALAAEHRHVAQRWQQQDWPTVVRRRDADCDEDVVCLGIALPPDADGVKLRLPVTVNASQVRALRAPLAIADVVEHAAARWREDLLRLHHAFAAQACAVGVYGSLALQALTGQIYLRPSSDIDLLFAPTDTQQLQQGIALLQAYAAVLPLDGEVALPDGSAVAWKEWAQAGHYPDQRVLLKRRSDVTLARVGDVLALLEACPCPV